VVVVFLEGGWLDAWDFICDRLYGFVLLVALCVVGGLLSGQG